MWRKNPISRSGRRHELQLVVLHPHDGARGGQRGGLLGETAVDGDVRVPPLAVVLRRDDDVVVERPQGAVGEALVVVLDLLLGQGDRDQPQAVVLELVEALVGRSVPADPRATLELHHGFEGGDQPAGRLAPRDRSVVGHEAVDGKAVGDDEEISLLGRHGATLEEKGRRRVAGDGPGR
jgi:hypothetical protein